MEIIPREMINYRARNGKIVRSHVQFLDFRRKQKTKPCHRLQHCRKSKIAAQFHFLFIVDRIKIEIKVMSQYSIKRKKSQKFLIWHYYEGLMLETSALQTLPT